MLAVLESPYATRAGPGLGGVIVGRMRCCGCGAVKIWRPFLARRFDSVQFHTWPNKAVEPVRDDDDGGFGGTVYGALVHAVERGVEKLGQPPFDKQAACRGTTHQAADRLERSEEHTSELQ